MPAKTLATDRRRTVKRNRIIRRISLTLKQARPHLDVPPELSRTTRHSSVFPPELYRNIFKWVTDKRDLYNLSLTSRMCSAEAQHVLYSVIDLAQDTRAPVLWADTILQHPQRAATVRSLTLRFDLSFIIVPDLLLSSLKSIAQALAALRKLEKLVLVGHPLAMMHPIHTWILDGCTADLRIFHNSVFPTWAVVSFLSRHPHIREWKQTGIYPNGVIPDTALPRLTTLDAHVSILASFKAPRPLTRLRLEIDDWGTQSVPQRRTIDAISLFKTTLTSLAIEDTSTTTKHRLSDLLIHLSKAAPNLSILAYTRASMLSILDLLSSDSIENLSKLVSLETLLLRLRRQKLPTDTKCVKAITERAFECCPSLRYLALKDEESYSYCRRRGSCSAEEDIGALLSAMLENDTHHDNPCPPDTTPRRTRSPYITS